MTCAAARNSAPRVRYSAAMPPRFTTRNSAPWMGLRLSTSPSAAPTTISAMSPNATAAVTASHRPSRRDRHRRPGHAVGAGRLQREQHLFRVDHAAPAVGRELEDPRIHPDRVLGAALHAVAAEHALAEVDVDAGRDLLDLRVRVLVGHDVDAVGR